MITFSELLIEIFSSIISAVTVRLFFQAFFYEQAKRIDTQVETTAYILFVAIKIGIVFIDSANLNLIANIIPLFLLTQLYLLQTSKIGLVNNNGRSEYLQLSLLSNVLTGIFITAVSISILSLIELYALRMTSYFKLKPSVDWGMSKILARISELAIAIIISRHRFQLYAKLKFRYQVLTIAPSLITLSLIGLIYLLEENWITSVMILGCILLSVFILFAQDYIAKYYQEKDVQSNLILLNRTIEQQLELQRKQMNATSIAQHDMKNVIRGAISLAKESDNSDVLDYLEKYVGSFVFDRYADTGNSIIDGIVNMGINKAEESNVTFDYEITVPEDLQIAPLHLVMIISNLIDNAIEAAEKCEQNRWVKITIELRQTCLFIETNNNFITSSVRPRGILTSSKQGPGHGIGLSSVQSALAYYRGNLTIQELKGVFTAKAFLYNMAPVFDQ